ncbi:Pre-mRNA splicing, partial [Kickxella alabastrina]
MQPLPVSELRDPEFEALYRGKLSEFNAVQTQCFHALYRTDDSALLAAAPGAGKTLAAEIALLRFFRQEAERAQLEGDSYVRRRALYIAPFATLVEQRTRAWQRRFASVQGGKSVVCLTGDAVADLRLLDDAHVALATPAQWDALSRRWRQRQRQCVRDIGLVIVDELHWIGGSGLGTSSDEDLLASLYEVVVSRVRYMAAQLDRHIRVVGLTVPLANARDVAAWIGAPASAVFNFAPSVRPSSPLEIRVVTSGIAHFASRMDAWVAPAYRAISRATIVFVPARKQCRSVSTALVDMALGDEAGSRFGTGDAMAVSVAVDDPVLGDLLLHGAAYYHEALSESDKAAVLAQFASGAVQVLVASRESCWALDHVHAPTVVIMGAE